MLFLVVAENPDRWPFEIAGVEVVAARDYLVQPRFSDLRRTRVLNFCRSYRYQSAGYYVSLLAEARGHKPQPGLAALQDMKSVSVLRLVTQDFDALIQKSLAALKADEFTLSIYFAKSLAARYERLARQLYDLFPAPLLRATFQRTKGEWQLHTLRPIPTSEIADPHRPEVLRLAAEFFAKGATVRPRRKPARYELAILVDPAESEPPSDERALRRFAKAAEELGVRPTRITRQDYSRLSEFDALLIRETTNVDHHTYRFASRAASDGIVVIDDPRSILRCTNKVYLAELFARHKLATPRTAILHRGNLDGIAGDLGLPCILKRPDSAYSQGVVKVETSEELAAAAEEFFETSELLIAQEFMPTEFDWRVGIFEGEPIYACRYHMARGHWQIIAGQGRGRRYGRVTAVPVASCPPRVVKLAVRAAHAIGDGLYGMDLKEVGGRAYLIEANDNPSIETGYEDQIVGMELYRRILAGIVRRIEKRAAESARR